MIKNISIGCFTALIAFSIFIGFLLWPNRLNKLFDFSERHVPTSFGTIKAELRGDWQDNDSNEKKETIRGNPYTMS